MMSKKTEKTHRLIYSLCFLSMCVINWGSVTLDGRVQFVLINLLGPIMAVIILTGYNIKDFQKRVYVIWIGFFFLLLIGIIPLYNSYPYKGKLITGIINIFIYGVIAIAVLEKNLVEKKRSNIKWLVFFCFIGMIILMLISRNEAIWPLWFGVMFGGFYLTEYKILQKKLIIDGLIIGVIAGFFLIQGLALLFRPYDIVRYGGLFINSNMNGLFYTVSYSAFLSGWFSLKKQGIYRILQILSFLFAGAMFAFALLTGCRTSFVSMIAITAVLMICFLWNSQGKFRKLIKYFSLLLVIGALSVPIVYSAVRYVPTIHLHPVFFGYEYNLRKVHSGEPWDSEKYISFDRMIEENLGKRIKGVFAKTTYDQISILDLPLVVEAAESICKAPETDNEEKLISSEESYTAVNIRFQIYKWYFSKLNLFGHKESEHGAPLTDEYTAPHAHNWWLQLTFNFGIPVGLILLAGSLLYVKEYISLIKRGNEIYACVIGCFATAFFIFGIFEVDYYPGQLSFTLFFFLFKYIIEQNESNSKHYVIENNINAMLKTKNKDNLVK